MPLGFSGLLACCDFVNRRHWNFAGGLIFHPVDVARHFVLAAARVFLIVAGINVIHVDVVVADGAALCCLSRDRLLMSRVIFWEQGYALGILGVGVLRNGEVRADEVVSQHLLGHL